MQYLQRETLEITLTDVHWDLKVSRSQAKIDENFSNYLLKTKANNKFFICAKGLQKSISE